MADQKDENVPGDITAIAIREDEMGINVKIYVQPRASETTIDGCYGDSLKIRVAAPPVEGAANDTCRRFLASLCHTARENVTLTAGQRGRVKLFRLHGISRDFFLRQVEAFYHGKRKSSR